MINALILTNLEEDCSRERTSEHLQLIQKVAGKVNFRVVKAIVDRTGCEMPYFEQVLDSLKHYSGEYDVIILDDTLGLSDTEAYDTLKEFTDDMNIPVYFYQYEEIFLPDDNDKFAYSDEPFEVCELRFYDDFSGLLSNDVSFKEGINSLWENIQEKLEELPVTERCKKKLEYFEELLNMAEVLVKQAKVVDDSVNSDLDLLHNLL